MKPRTKVILETMLTIIFMLLAISITTDGIQLNIVAIPLFMIKSPKDCNLFKPYTLI